MFTFSFGSAFADASAPLNYSDTYAKANVSALYSYVADEQAKAEAAIDKAESDALYAIFAGKTSVEFGDGKLVVTADQVKAYYQSEVTAKAKAQASKEASAIYAQIQNALSDDAVEYITVITTGDEGKWTASNGDIGYNVKVVFTKTVNGAGDNVDKSGYTGYSSVFGSAGTGTKSGDIAKDAFAAMVTTKLAEIAAISPESYIAKDQDAVATLKTKATTLVTQIGANVAAGSYTFDAVSTGTLSGTGWDSDLTLDSSASNLTAGFAKALAAIYTPAVNEAKAAGVLATELNKLSLSADEPTQAAKLAWARTQVMDKFEDAIDTAYDTAVKTANETLLNESLKGSKADQAKIDAANETIENAKEEKAAALEIAKYLVEKCDTLNLLIVENSTNFANSTVRFGTGTFAVSSGTYYNWNYKGKAIASPLIKTASNLGYYGNLDKVVGYVQDIKDDAAALRADIAIDGTLAADIDTLEADAIEAVYKTGAAQTIAGNTKNEVLHARQHALTGVDCHGTKAAKTTVKIGEKTYDVVNSWNQTNYEDARLDEVKSIKKETKANIMAATSVDDAEAAFLAGLDKYKAVLSKNDKALNVATKAYTDLKAKYETQLTAEVAYAIAGITAEKSTENVATSAKYVTSLKADLAEAYTTDELTEIYTKLSAEVKALKNKTTLDGEKSALEARCKAFSNKTVTLDDKTELVTLRNDVAAFRTYATRIGATYTVADYGLNAKVKAVADLEKKAIEEQYKTINKDSKATLDEADAVEALRKAVDAYNDGWSDFKDDLETGHGFTYAELSVTNLDKFEKDIFNAQVSAVETQIAKLPADGSDIAATKAARTAYDALTLCQKVTVADRYYDKLVDAEKVNTNSVAALKLKASSTAKKGSITVKWTVTGEADIDGYEIWKSTKMNKGFKKAFTTTKTTYKNTKDLKKGTRYYYKVRAYKMVDGVKVTSDWSNKAYRKAK